MKAWRITGIVSLFIGSAAILTAGLWSTQCSSNHNLCVRWPKFGSGATISDSMETAERGETIELCIEAFRQQPTSSGFGAKSPRY